MTKQGEEAICALCRHKAKLELSHLIPSFVFRWLKDTSPTGHLRMADNINKRVQDGFKEKLLCRNCEQKFSIWENAFNKEFFSRATAKKEISLNYSPSLALFGASIVWRLAVARSTSEARQELNAGQRIILENGADRWRKFLSGEVSNYGTYSIHLFDQWRLHDAVHEDLPGNWNRYLSRYVEIDFPSTSKEEDLMVYAKLGPISVFAHLSRPKHQWIGTRIRPNGGQYLSSKVSLPSNLFEYYRYRSSKGFATAKAISENQSNKIDEALVKDIERTVSSEAFTELQLDVNRFGSDAFKKKGKN